MNPIFSDTKSKLTLSQINVIENYVGLEFPSEYKVHLLLYNGGKCYPKNFYFYEDNKITSSYIRRFFAIYEGESYNLLFEIDCYKKEEKRLPFQMLPIALDDGGNLICISCQGEDKGYVYFWDHEKEVDYNSSDDCDYSNLYLIAKGFSLFLQLLSEE